MKIDSLENKMAVYDKENMLWRSMEQHPFDDTEMSLGQRIWDAISVHGSKVAQINDETAVQMTYEEIRLKAIRAAQNLLKRRFKPRDVFGFLADHSDDLVPIMVATLFLACPMATFHPMLSKEEIVRFLRKAKPSIVFCDVSAFDQLDKALKELPFSVQVFTFGGRIDGYEPVESLFVETGEENQFEPVTIDKQSDVGIISCSSGSTGLCLYYDVPIFMQPNLYDASNVVYFADGIFWTVGIKQILDCVESGALRIITTETTSLSYMHIDTPLRLIEKYNVTILPIAAFDLIACLKTDRIRTAKLASVREISVYGGHIPNNLIDQVRQYFPNARITVCYGMTEIGFISYNHPQDTNDNGGTFADGYTIKVVDKDGKRCGPNVTGELCLKKEHTFRDYLDDATATASTFDGEGFFQTGDIVCIDDDCRLFIKDRKKNLLTLFYFDGILVPCELEECLINVPGIKEVCIVGVPIVGSATLPAALIVPKPKSNLNARNVFDKIADQFPKRSWLRAGVYFVESLPKTNNGKLMRREIVKMASEMFEAAKQSDADIQSYLLDIPIEYRQLI